MLFEIVVERKKKSSSHKKTVVFDPSKSEAYRALQEEGYGNYAPQEVTIPVQTKVFHPPSPARMNRMIPGKKPVSPRPAQLSPTLQYVSQDDAIRQSGSFNRLMYSVLGATNY